ncbi:hypothetical protein F5B19DRAFT_500444 [Rostrohypoxylon terebratum]|nr:hypothetical protein F5B19DRAFT_500444 [Rostrohypoxylon terebratum]
MDLSVVDLCAIPAGIPPEGQISNFIDPDTLMPATIAVCVVMTVLAILFAAARTYTNRKVLKLGDYFIIAGAIFDIGYTAVILAIAPYYRHFWDIPACWLNGSFLKVTFSNTTLVGPVLYFSKSAIFLMFRQVFSVHKHMRIYIYIGLIATFLIYFPSIPLSAIFTAPRVGQSWEDLLATGSPRKLIYWGVVQGSLSIVLDIYIFILPLPILVKLNLSPKKRFQLVAIFAAALLGVAASAVALYFRVQEFYTTDSTWIQAGLENNAAIIVASMPAFASFMRSNVLQSSALKSLQSRLNLVRYKPSATTLEESFQRPKLETFGSPRQRSPRYYELMDATFMGSQVAVSQDYQLERGHGKYGGSNIRDSTQD